MNEKGEVKTRIEIKHVKPIEFDEFYSQNPFAYKMIKVLKNTTGERDVGFTLAFRVVLTQEWLEEYKEQNNETYKCYDCRDTGKIENKYCTCELGRIGKKYFSEKKEEINPKPNLKALKDLREFLVKKKGFNLKKEKIKKKIKSKT